MKKDTPVCCEPCEDIGTCRTDANCCLECHFSYEEQIALPYLPAHLQRRLQGEHAHLMRNGFPSDAVQAHAEREMAWFRRYCPPEVVALVEHDHDLYEQGKLHTRSNALAVRQNPRVAGALVPPPTRRLQGLIAIGNSQAALRAIYRPLQLSSG